MRKWTAKALLFIVSLVSFLGRAAALNDDIWAGLADFDVLGQHGVPRGVKLLVYALVALHALAFAFWLISVLFPASRAKAKRS